MACDHKGYGMDSSIPFIGIANRVEVDVDLTARRVAGQRWYSKIDQRAITNLLGVHAAGNLSYSYLVH